MSRIKKEETLNVDRLENVETEEFDSEDNTIEKTPIQKMIIYVYMIIIAVLFAIGGYILYNYLYGKKIETNLKQGGGNTSNIISEMDRKQITTMIKQFLQ